MYRFCSSPFSCTRSGTQTLRYWDTETSDDRMSWSFQYFLFPLLPLNFLPSYTLAPFPLSDGMSRMTLAFCIILHVHELHLQRPGFICFKLRYPAPSPQLLPKPWPHGSCSRERLFRFWSHVHFPFFLLHITFFVSLCSTLTLVHQAYLLFPP